MRLGIDEGRAPGPGVVALGAVPRGIDFNPVCRRVTIQTALRLHLEVHLRGTPGWVGVRAFFGVVTLPALDARVRARQREIGLCMTFEVEGRIAPTRLDVAGGAVGPHALRTDQLPRVLVFVTTIATIVSRTLAPRLVWIMAALAVKRRMFPAQWKRGQSVVESGSGRQFESSRAMTAAAIPFEPSSVWVGVTWLAIPMRQWTIEGNHLSLRIELGSELLILVTLRALQPGMFPVEWIIGSAVIEIRNGTPGFHSVAMLAVGAERSFVRIGVAVRAIGLQSKPSLSFVDGTSRLFCRCQTDLVLGIMTLFTLESGVSTFQPPAASFVLEFRSCAVGPVHELELGASVFGVTLLALLLAHVGVEAPPVLAQKGDALVTLETMFLDALLLQTVTVHAVGIAFQRRMGGR